MPQYPRDPLLKRLRRAHHDLLIWLRRARSRKARHEVIDAHRRKKNAITRRIRHRRRVLTLRRRHRGFVWYDGHQVCGWIADELEKARRHGWRGHVISGYRTPAYSESLCLHMCGRPSCPGRCAGRNTNHARGPAYPAGAVDCSDFYTLQRICVRYGLRIHNGLPRTDPPHFSHAGN